ncbi:hypothetical protein BS50DRAFT_306010 [Corynespora cassiicola Philippines]|uniref:Uncharacterized protein n=1 Tax=Corynespora cassiicola Philippines TaxID=1448308 RepID=A0A2T2NXW6_CORCC|nr:hypothetical protein BS50DRAFT_306010 [Corynespora cassiicola Philippines]
MLPKEAVGFFRVSCAQLTASASPPNAAISFIGMKPSCSSCNQPVPCYNVDISSSKLHFLRQRTHRPSISSITGSFGAFRAADSAAEGIFLMSYYRTNCRSHHSQT